MAPDGYYTAIARVSLAVVRGRPAIEWLPKLEASLARAPSSDEAVTYARASAIGWPAAS